MPERRLRNPMLDAQSLIAFSYWEDGAAVYENCERIADAYAYAGE